MGTSLATQLTVTRTGVAIAVCNTKFLGCHGVAYCFAEGVIYDEPSREWVSWLVKRMGISKVFEHECQYCKSVKRGLRELQEAVCTGSKTT